MIWKHFNYIACAGGNSLFFFSACFTPLIIIYPPLLSSSFFSCLVLSWKVVICLVYIRFSLNELKYRCCKKECMMAWVSTMLAYKVKHCWIISLRTFCLSEKCFWTSSLLMTHWSNWRSLFFGNWEWCGGGSI